MVSRLSSPASSSRPPSSSAAPLVLFLLVAIGIGAAGALSYAGGANDLRRQKERELAAIAALKVEEIVRWRDERFADAEWIASHPALAAAAESPPGPGRARAEATVGSWLEALCGTGEASGIALVSASGEVRSAAGDVRAETADAGIRDLVARSLRERRPLLSDVHRHADGDAHHLTMVAPLRPASGEARWAVVVRIDPHRWLYRMIQSWPTPSATAETLLVHGAGDRVAIANELRHWQGDPEALLVPLSSTQDPAVLASSGARGVVEGVDYRSRDVLAAVVAVPGSPWTLVAKVDVAEALASLRALRLWTIVVVVALLLAAGAGAALWLRVQQTAFERSRYEAEEERRSLAHRLEHLTKYALDLIIMGDERLRILEVNDRALEALGYTREELVGMPVQALRDPATVGDFGARVRQEVDEGASLFETRYRRKDGTTFPVEVSVHTDEYEGRRYFQGIVRDISSRKQAEEALRASEAKFRAAFEYANIGVLLVSSDGRIVETNRAFRTMLRYGDEEMRGLPLLRLHEPGDGPPPSDVLGSMATGGVDAVELPRRYVRRDGTIADVIQRASAVRDEAGVFRFAMFVVEDVSEKKRMEAQLLLADRMASVGTLAAGVAHEINNPLAFIIANLDYALAALRETGTDAEILRALDDAKDGGTRVREIVRDLKAFSRPTDELREPVDLRRVLQSAIALAANELRHRAQLVVDAGEVPPVLASEHRIAQVLLNLLINAAQALPDGHASENRVRAATYAGRDGRAIVEISDTGSGIPPEILPRIFDPFFTTKPVGVGTGLGLSICHGIVTGLGGDIEVESAPGKGTTFRVRLPPCKPAAAAAAEGARPAPPARRGRILVVDDEALVGRAVSRILSPHHEVLARTSARTVLDDVGREPSGFDVLLCDLMMPDMTGMELFGRLAEIAPGLAQRTIFLTGGAFTEGAREFLDRVQNERLEKPFEPRALRELVSKVLAATERAA